MVKVKQIEFIGLKGDDPCNDAIRDLRLISRKYAIPIKIRERYSSDILERESFPKTCLVGENNIMECIYGWSNHFYSDVVDFIERGIDDI
jgi:hypothetical protein